MKVRDLLSALEQLAPKGLAEDYDNVGLLVGNSDAMVTKVITSLDCTLQVLKEALEIGCNTIVSHHPLIFKGLKSITGKNDVEQMVVFAIKNDLNLIAFHTNYDNVFHGVNRGLAIKLGLKNLSILSPKVGTLQKLTTFIPMGEGYEDAENKVMTALHNAGAGQIGEYKDCSFRSEGLGYFLPTEGTNPTIGHQGKHESVPEKRIEVLLSSLDAPRVLKALKASHPYEEVAYFLSDLKNSNHNIGAGMIGELLEALTPDQFPNYVAKCLGIKTLKFTSTHKKQIKKVAVCGGSGSFLISSALALGADAYVTSDVKYHDFFIPEERLMLCDVGHYESEAHVPEMIKQYLEEIFPNIAVLLTTVNTNPVKYL